ncbi:MAG TPA: cytochrome c-type biogenesis protein [Burkholderiales bacterium]|nr:cytochrome c-type biogenesis protein [Burkholderiales bacterium]
MTTTLIVSGIMLFLAMALPGTLHAADAPLAAADPQIENRVKHLAEELRCLVCQNQTIADSSAPLAVDLREQVRDQVRQGKSDTEIIDYVVARYGDFVRYRPPLKVSTVLLWFGPALLLLAAFVVLMRRLRAGRSAAAAPLSAAEHERATALLAENGDAR